MSPTLLTYLRLVRAGFRRFTTYRWALAAGVVANAVFGFIRASVFAALVASAGGSVAGYSAASLSTYNWLSQGLIGPLNIWGSGAIAERVRSGDIAVDLARPLDLQLGYLAQDLGRAAASVLPRTVPTVIIGALTFGVALPTTWLPWVAGLVSIVLGVAISFLASFAMQLSAFWLLEIRGVQTLYMVVSGLLAGLVVPVQLMPGWMQTLAYATPFPAMMQLPVDILSGRAAGAEIGWNMLIQLAWLAALLVLGRVLLAAGSRRLVVNGG